MQKTTVECRNCHTTHSVEYWGSESVIETTPCAGCGADLCSCCEQFICTGCDEVFCLEHLVKYDGEEACPACAAFWAQDAVRKLKDQAEERLERQLQNVERLIAEKRRAI